MGEIESSRVPETHVESKYEKSFRALHEIKELCKKFFPKDVTPNIDFLTEKQEELTQIAQQIQLKLEELAGLQKDENIKEYITHDLGAVFREFHSFFGFFLVDIGNKDKHYALYAYNLLCAVRDRYMVGMEDICLRGISPESVDTKYYQDGLDVDALAGAVQYLLSNEKKKMQGNSEKYGNIDNITIDTSGFDPDALASKLGGRIINAPTGLVGNFVMNEFRNDCQDRIEAQNISLSCDIVKNRCVIKIADDGKGMKPENLDKDDTLNKELLEQHRNTYYIFDKGTSGDSEVPDEKKSTGLGIALFDKRIGSIPGAKLRVITRRKMEDGNYSETELTIENGQHTVITTVCTTLDEKRLEEITSETGTIFTVSLPLVEKNK